MDPNVTFDQMIAALDAGDGETAREYAGYLNDWLQRGGFPPARDDYRARLDAVLNS